MAHTSKPNPKGGRRYVAYFRHWRSGQILRASDYGYKGWPIG